MTPLIHCPDCGALTHISRDDDGDEIATCTNEECSRIVVTVLSRRRQETIDRLTPQGPPPTNDWADEAESNRPADEDRCGGRNTLTRRASGDLASENGQVQVRALAALALALTLVAGLYLFWPYLAGGGVMIAAWKVLTRGTRRPRPRSSWATYGKMLAALFAAWNTRYLRGTSFRASVPASAASGHFCPECGSDHSPRSSQGTTADAIPYS